MDCRCQTRTAVAARKLGIIKADVAVGLSLSLAHKAVGFDRRITDVDVDTLDYLPTATLPVGVEGGDRHSGVRNNRQQLASRSGRRRLCDPTTPATPRRPRSRAAVLDSLGVVVAARVGTTRLRRDRRGTRYPSGNSAVPDQPGPATVAGPAAAPPRPRCPPRPDPTPQGAAHDRDHRHHPRTLRAALRMCIPASHTETNAPRWST